ncbi:MAG: ATP-binding protein [Pirellulaceae bacterium]|nr:ATP-binding protein [Pirellulaceae bacterium]
MILESGLVKVSSAQLQVLLEMPCVNFFSLDEEYRYTFFTKSHAQAIRELWGVDISVGTNFLSEVVRDTHERAKVGNSLYWALADNDFTVTEALGTPNVLRRLYDNRYCPTKTEDGKICGITVYMTDITERFQIENQRSALDRKLLESSHLASLGLMVGCVTHDFNNLLLPVLLNAELALKTLEPNHPADELLREVIASVHCASSLTKQLLSLSGAEDADKHVVDLNEVVNSASELSRVSIGRRAELCKSLDTIPLLVNANETQLRQVIVNLLTNASEAGNGERLRITIETASVLISGPIRTQRMYTPATPSGEYAVLTVHDNGCGMSAEQLERIFQPFFSTKGDGRGLGMTAVQGIVNNHKGFLAIDSTPGVGSTFRVGFPIAKSIASSYALDEAALLLDEKSPFQPLRLLIVDDNSSALKSVSSICSMLGHSVANAIDEAVAVAAIITGQFDLVLLDADLANRASARILNSIPDHLLTPVVLMSATGQHGTILDQPRVHTVLMKPFSTATLVSTLQRIQPIVTDAGDARSRRTTSAASHH